MQDLTAHAQLVEVDTREGRGTSVTLYIDNSETAHSPYVITATDFKTDEYHMLHAFTRYAALEMFKHAFCYVKATLQEAAA